MKAIKRTVAALLATLMLATSTSFSLAAETYTANEAEAVGKVNAAGIMTGTDKGFEPSKSLTRAEAAAIIVRMKGISESAVKATAGTTLFTDVPASHWASGYVNQASNLGIVKGVSATEFAPDREVTVAEFTTMAVRALGAGQLVDSEGTWPTNYVNFANENGLLDDVNAIYTAVSSRLNAAIIVANSLYSPMWEKVGVKSNGEIEWGKNQYDPKTIVEDVLKLEEDLVLVDTISTKEHTVNGFDVREDFDLSTLKYGITYHVFWNEAGDEIQGFWLEDETVEFTAVAKEYKADKNTITLTVDGKDKEYKLAALKDANNDPVDVLYTKNEKAGGKVKEITKDNKDWYGSITVNDKNEIVSMSVFTFDTYFIVDEVTKSTVKVSDKAKIGADYAKQSTGLKFTTEDNEYILTKDGASMNFADLEEGDAVRLYKVEDFDGTNDKYVAEVIEPKTGKVTAKGSDYIKLDGTKYSAVKLDDTHNLVKDIDVNDEIEVYLNNAGKVVMYKVVESENSSDVAIVSYKKGYTDKYGEANYDIKLTFMDGTQSDILNVDLEDTYEAYIDNTAEATAVAFINAKLEESYADMDAVKAAVTTADKEKVGYEYAATKLNLGGLICYEINGDQLTVVPEDDEFVKDATATQIKVDKKATYLTVKGSGVANYYFGDNTIVYSVKYDKDYAWKVEKIDLDDLDDTDITAGHAWVVGYDADDTSKEVDYVIIQSEKFARTTETNFAYIKEVAATKYDDKDAQEVTFIMLDGTEKTYTYAKSKANNEDLEFGKTVLAEGCVVDLDVNDDFIMDATKPNGADGTDVLATFDADYIYVKDVVNGRIVLAKTANDTKSLFLDDELLVIRVKSNQDSAVKKVADIGDINEVDFDDDATDRDTLTAVWTYVDEDGETSVIAIVYYDADDYKA